jgi:hypothetical protein
VTTGRTLAGAWPEFCRVPLRVEEDDDFPPVEGSA